MVNSPADMNDDDADDDGDYVDDGADAGDAAFEAEVAAGSYWHAFTEQKAYDCTMKKPTHVLPGCQVGVTRSV